VGSFGRVQVPASDEASEDTLPHGLSELEGGIIGGGGQVRRHYIMPFPKLAEDTRGTGVLVLLAPEGDRQVLQQGPEDVTQSVTSHGLRRVSGRYDAGLGTSLHHHRRSDVWEATDRQRV
jgi:hypothetical protein